MQPPSGPGSSRPLAALALALAFLATPPSLAAPAGADLVGHAQVTALAIEETASGYVGSAARVEATVLGQGHGRVYVSTKPLAQTDMQGSARLAAQVAAATLGIPWQEHDYLVSFTSDSTVIGGPSAGADMALALTAALHNQMHPDDLWVLDPSVAATGTINADATIGPVGGVPAKAEGAAAAGITTFLYPAGLETATTVKADARGQLRTVSVDMERHCRGLGIECRPVPTLAELLRESAHVDLAQAPAPLPATSGYADAIGPGIRSDAALLAARLPRLNDTSGLTRSQAAIVQPLALAAADALQEARKALSEGRYYAAATAGFQGAIAAGRAENLTAFFRSGRSEAVVASALASCEAALSAAKADPPAVQGINDLFAVGAAQSRLADATALRDRAATLETDARTFDDFTASILASVFCAERARTASWWASLTERFPPGPAVDPQALAQEAVDRAADMVSYSDAVLATVQADTSGPDSALAQARSDFAAGRPGAAILHAVEAESSASVAMQTGGGRDVPPQVLAAARQGAADAVARARAAGIEPILSVSLVELAAGRDGAEALQDYWSARSLALLGTTPVATSEVPATVRPTPPQASLALVAGGAGFLLGAVGAALLILSVNRKAS